MLIAARGNPHLPALSDSPVKLVASVIRAWWGRGWEGGEGYTTLLNNCGASQIENSKGIPRRYQNLALSAWPTRGGHTSLL